MSFLIVDIEASQLTSSDIRRIKHPSVAGIILFSRNYKNKNQLVKLIKDIRSVKENILITVDYEGGRVQRFKDQFTLIPAMRQLGFAYEKNKDQTLLLTKKIGWLISKELGEIDIDFSFTPVLDIDYASSSIIGDRSFHYQGAIISELAKALIDGLSMGGMQAIGKHFPGHGYIKEDTHLETAIDSRSYEEIKKHDIKVFMKTLDSNMSGIMTSHVIYEKCDKYPSTFSNFWINKILKQSLGFKGLIFTDDLSMSAAANFFPSITERLNKAFSAGIDIALICNAFDRVDEALMNENWDYCESTSIKIKNMRLDKKKNDNCSFLGQSLNSIQEEVNFFTKNNK